MRQDYLRRLICRAIYNEDLARNARPLQTCLTPIHEFTHCNLFIQGRNHDADIDGPGAHAGWNKMFYLFRHESVLRALLSWRRSRLPLKSAAPSNRAH